MAWSLVRYPTFSLSNFAHCLTSIETSLATGCRTHRAIKPFFDCEYATSLFESVISKKVTAKKMCKILPIPNKTVELDCKSQTSFHQPLWVREKEQWASSVYNKKKDKIRRTRTGKIYMTPKLSSAAHWQTVELVCFFFCSHHRNFTRGCCWSFVKRVWLNNNKCYVILIIDCFCYVIYIPTATAIRSTRCVIETLFFLWVQ